MFRIKNVRNATVAKQSAIPATYNQRKPLQPAPKAEDPKPLPVKVNAARITREASNKKDVGKRPEVQRRLVLRDKAVLPIKANIAKPATRAAAKVVPLEEKEET